MKNKKIMFITILLLAIGFAAVSTSLIINGNISFNTNEDDFDVYFSSAVIDGSDYSNEIISEDKQSITYETKNLSFIGDTSVLEYEVTNASKNYDAEVKVICTEVSEEVTLTHTPETQVIPATDIGNGKVEIKLNKTVVDEKEIAFTCTLNVNAVERESLGENKIANTDTYVIEGNYVDESGNAIANANLVIFSETPHYVTTNENGYLFYNGLERGSHEIYHVEDTLENIKSMTKEEIISNAKTSAKFTTKTDGDIEFSNSSKLTNSEVITSKTYCEPLIGTTWNFTYTGDEQEFNTICDGEYKIELWGAQGNHNSRLRAIGGNGAYTSGILKIERYSNFYVYVGEHRIDRESSFNCGSIGGDSIDSKNNGSVNGYGGGGATDIRLVNGDWNNFDSLKSRIMIASGGGGATDYAAPVNGGYGGALIGGSANNGYYDHGLEHIVPTGGTQTFGGSIGIYPDESPSGGYGVIGAFGIGGNGNITGVSFGDGTGNWGSGGGGGYYGGAGGGWTNCSVDSGAGGSSFISGHNGCDAISSESAELNIIHTGQAKHYSGYVFTDTVMKAGNETMPSYDGTSTMTGNTGNGYAKITLVSLN